MSAVFVVWFVSGVVMMYAGGMPELGAGQRLERMPALDLAAVRFSPAAAAAQAGMPGYRGAVTLQTLLGRPAYLYGDLGLRVFADTGEVFERTTQADAKRAAAQFVGLEEARLEFAGTVAAPDQWTLTQAAQLPLDRFVVDDDAGTWVYVSQYSGEVTLAMNRRARVLAWLGTIPHWFYFTPLRVNQPLWYWTVVWTAVLGCVLAVLGLVLGVTQFRRSKPFSLEKSIRYRGWMRWHYYTGVVFGLFALTWAFSGLMSMEPFAWTNARGLEIPREVLQGGDIDLDGYAALDHERLDTVLVTAELKEIEYVRILGEPYFVARYTPDTVATERERLHQPYTLALGAERSFALIDAQSFDPRAAPFAIETLVERLGAAAGGAAIADYELLRDYDAYYYSRGRQAPLPVLRVKFDDPLETWYYVDPAMGRIVGQVHRLSRVERWLFNGLHSLDFGFWYDRRPLWDVVMIGLSLGALVTSLIGLCFGMKRLWPKRVARQARPETEAA